MKRTVLKLGLAAILSFAAVFTSVNAQEEATEESSSSISFSTGVDVYSSYVWRGSKFGTGPAFQPYVEFAAGGFALGAWGSVSSGLVEAAEMDLYAAYAFDFGLSLGVTDYYYPGSMFFEYSDTISSHAFEANLGYEIGGLSLSANYMLNNSSLGAGGVGGDMYFELGYSFDMFSVFLGAGDGWHTTTGEFEVCNIGVSTEKEISITDKFSIPVSGSVILNPQQEQFYIVVGMSF